MNKQHRPRICTICHTIHIFKHIFWVQIITMAQHIRAGEHVQTAQTQIIRVYTICHTNHIYIMHLHHQNVPAHQMHVQTGHTQTCTICHITHSHVITSLQWPFILGQKLYTLPEWPMYWDRSVCTNSADPDLIRVCTIWHTANIYMLYLRIVESTCSSLSAVTIWQNA